MISIYEAFTISILRKNKDTEGIGEPPLGTRTNVPRVDGYEQESNSETRKDYFKEYGTQEDLNRERTQPIVKLSDYL